MSGEYGLESECNERLACNYDPASSDGDVRVSFPGNDGTKYSLFVRPGDLEATSSREGLVRLVTTVPAAKCGTFVGIYDSQKQEVVPYRVSTEHVVSGLGRISMAGVSS
ncbi:hypothetical protein HN604_02160 [archaeon]|jgi:hypothetical protein|nr:hypothetical protein [archaeon]MBT6182591.1 hypothetical protein [archaeon]MBT6606269.1 hypothetical protein [archaeon]MBT7251562.1 hypothetical protein [archaeon]MBT7660865.1 hypothetical protein [archaeon]